MGSFRPAQHPAPSQALGSGSLSAELCFLSCRPLVLARLKQSPFVWLSLPAGAGAACRAAYAQGPLVCCRSPASPSSLTPRLL